MLNQTSIAAVDEAVFLQGWQRPLYGSYCFSEIPGTVKRLLGCSLSDRAPLSHPLSHQNASGLPVDVFGTAEYPAPQSIVLFLMDAFGWNLFERGAREQVIGLSRFVEDGVVSKLSTLFPSTTTAHVHCLNSGLLPHQSQVFEWRQLWPSLDRVISPLIFSKGEDAGGREHAKSHTLLDAGIPPEQVFPPSPLHQQLRDRGVEVMEYLPAAYANGCYAQAVNPMIQRRGYDQLEAGLQDLTATLNRSDSQQYIRFYIPDIDSLSHDHGYDSDIVWQRLKELFAALEQIVFAGLTRQSVAILLTADHGQIVCDSAKTIYLDEAVPALMPMLARNQQGVLLSPCGSIRDLFLQVKPEFTQTALELLQQRLAGIAQVLLVETVADVLFGPSPNPDFLATTGQIVILPEGDHTVFLAGSEGQYKMHKRGTHGGLTPAEAQIPFAYLGL